MNCSYKAPNHPKLNIPVSPHRHPIDQILLNNTAVNKRRLAVVSRFDPVQDDDMCPSPSNSLRSIRAPL